MSSGDQVNPKCTGKRVAHLHHADGTHRTTPPTTRGRALALYERQLQRHLDDLAKGEGEAD